MTLAEIIREVAPMSDEGLSLLEPLLTEESVPAGSMIIKEGATSKYLYFIRSGCLRNFALEEDGHETTRWFATDGDLVASMYSFAAGEPAIASVEALTDVVLYKARIQDIKRLIEESHEWALWGCRYLCDGLYVLERRYTFLGHGDAMTRYLNLQRMRTFEILNKIPLQYIASYLGITPQTLSRVRRRLAEG
ncbi:MAG: Crp/Fnr family transcriptional regulator [Muribaculaceae bacterium]|nr:Crp/Fnr family transcriptional regulator [Muribaculaceae bacterium]